MGRIALLSEDLINQIAAGEVVERPASVVKELGENAIDAGAKQIRIRVEGGGLERIAIADDGVGMSREDAQAAVLRHATSKLRDLEGLSAIATLGFRGEALAAIASVSRFCLTSCERGAGVGTRVEIEGGGPAKVSDAPAAEGTEIVVEELFFNTPARRKFLRKAETELKHLEEAVMRLALANPAVGFSLEQDGWPIWSVRAGAPLRERLVAAVGPELEAHLVELDERRLGLRVHGAIATPDYTLPTTRGLYTFVNGRFVRDRQLHFALTRAFGQALPHGRQPVGAVFLEIDPHEVDVNVHPQKLEVRFRDARVIGEAMQAAIARALNGASRPPEPERGAEVHYASAVDRFLRAAEQGQGAPLPLPRVEDLPRDLAFGQARPTINEAPPPGFFASLRFIGALHRRFWLCEGQGGTLVVVDPHAALERLAREALEKPAKEDTLFRRTVELPAAETERVLALRGALGELGIVVEPFGGSSLAIERFPPSLLQADLASVLAELSTVLPRSEPLTAELRSRALRVLACHAATPSGCPTGHDEVARVLQSLDRCDFSRGCVHGRAVLFELPLLELERRAGAKFDGP